MPTIGDLNIRLGLNSSGLTKGLGQVERKMSTFERRFSGLGAKLSLGFTLPIAAALGASVKNFDAQEKALAQVEAGLKSTGHAAGFTSEQLQKMASDLQSKTLFGDEVILKDATAQLLTFTNLAGEQFERTQVVALDLATRIGGDLKGATIGLGKALNDPVANLSALGERGIQFSKEQKEVINSLATTGRLAEAQTVILEELEKQYGGSAEAAAAAGLGPFKQFQMAMNDITEDIGGLVLPHLVALAKTAKNLLEGFDGLSDGFKRNAVTVALVLAAIGPVTFAFGKILGLIAGGAGLIKQIVIMARAMWSFAVATTAAGAPVYAVIAAALLFDAIAIYVADNWQTFGAVIANVWIGIRNKISDILGAIGGTLDKFFKKLTGRDLGISDAVGIDRLEKRDVPKLKSVGETFDSVKSKISGFLGIAKKEGAGASNSIDGLAGSFAGLNEEVEKLTTGNGSGGGGSVSFARWMDAFKGGNRATLPGTNIPPGEAGIKPTSLLPPGEEDRLSTAGNLLLNIKDTVAGLADVVQGGLATAFEQIASGASSLGSAFKSFAGVAVDAIKQVIQSLARMLLVQYVASFLQSLGPVGIFLTPIAIAAGMGLVKGLLSFVPALAMGGLAFGPTLAMVGDNPGAKTNPEVIAPLNTLTGLMDRGPREIVVTGMISGDDLVLIQDRVRTKQNRRS